ncbi:MAG: hypothetical protein ABSB57_05610 [Dehalococcoidia bacterium]
MSRLKLFGEPQGGGTDDHSALTNLDYAKAGHTGFLSLGTPQTVTAEKIIDSAVGLRFGHAGGPLLQSAASGDDLALTGDLAISGSIGLPNLVAGRVVNLQKTVSVGVIPCGIAIILTADANGPIGVYGGATYTGSGANRSAKGLDFQATSNTSAAMNQLTGLNMQVNMQSSGNVGTVCGGVIQKSYSGTGRPTTSKGLYIGDFGSSGAATAIGLHIYDQAGAANNYLIEAGPAAPYLRLLGGASPGPNQTNLYLAEGATPSLRRVQWKDGAAIGSGDKVMVLV